MTYLKKFPSSSKELGHVQTLAVCAMMLALRVILGIFTNFTLAIMPFVKIGFSFIPIVIVAYLYGPVCAAIVSGAGDILSIILANPTAFSMNPALTACYIWEGIIYGVILYQSAFNLKEIIIAKVAVLVLCALPLNTLILSGMMNIPYFTLLLYRAAVLVPFGVIEVLITRFIIKPVLSRIKIIKT
ncbi:MAG: folate family ECF transporter S component [Ruminococcus sp.]|uniref:folate family ECF transporter S component n=1 Tax=Ruminococcus sp. TaxID=41978 RepID=UPI0028736F1D|nr:folate family ECF transporter S component [Ruminococcus sp.]MBQ3284144.1 folate family ECF transporter S component [Ruminococcus sp.]